MLRPHQYERTTLADVRQQFTAEQTAQPDVGAIEPDALRAEGRLDALGGAPVLRGVADEGVESLGCCPSAGWHAKPSTRCRWCYDPRRRLSAFNFTGSPLISASFF